MYLRAIKDNLFFNVKKGCRYLCVKSNAETLEIRSSDNYIYTWKKRGEYDKYFDLDKESKMLLKIKYGK